MLLNRVQQEINELNQQIKAIDAAVGEARTELTNAKSLLATRTAEMNDRRATLARQQEELSRLQNDPRLTQISFEIDNEQLAREERLNLDSLTGFKGEAATAQTEVAK